MPACTLALASASSDANSERNAVLSSGLSESQATANVDAIMPRTDNDIRRAMELNFFMITFFGPASDNAGLGQALRVQAKSADSQQHWVNRTERRDEPRY